MHCEIGDIVFADRYEYQDGTEGKYHNFVIMDIERDEITVVPLEYFGFTISSQIEKNNTINKNYPYNEPISPDENNRLKKESHVKCDELIVIKPKHVIMKWGNVTKEQYEKFVKLFEKSLMIRG